jgi:hypothetical protein
VHGLGVQIGHVARAEVAKEIVVGTIEDHGQLAAPMTVQWQLAARRNAQQHEVAAADACSAYALHTGCHATPAQGAHGAAEPRMQRTRQAVGIVFFHDTGGADGSIAGSASSEASMAARAFSVGASTYCCCISTPPIRSASSKPARQAAQRSRCVEATTASAAGRAPAE